MGMASRQIALNEHVTTPSSGYPARVWLALAAVYIIWGSTYLAMDIAVDSIPPYMMSATRNLIAGVLMFSFLYWRGGVAPTRVQWRNGFIVGALLLGGGQGGVAFAEQWVSSGLAALMVATVPLWAAFWNTFWERKPTQIEAVGLGIGIVGVVILNVGSDLWGNTLGAAVLIVSPMFWSLGSIWSRHLDLAKGMMSTATILIGGGIFVSVMSLITGEAIHQTPDLDSMLATLFLVIFGSIIAFSAYNYLLKSVEPAVATSYAYVNPVIAVMLGWALLGESITILTVIAAALILTAVFIITAKPYKRKQPAQ
jgi:drug/metabolite transporter (DMT)-like permease